MLHCQEMDGLIDAMPPKGILTLIEGCLLWHRTPMNKNESPSLQLKQLGTKCFLVRAFVTNDCLCTCVCVCLLRSYRHCLFKQCCLRNFKDTTSTSAQSIYFTRQPLVLTLSEHTAQSLFNISYMCNRNGYTRNEHRPLELHCTAAARSRVRRLSFVKLSS